MSILNKIKSILSAKTTVFMFFFVVFVGITFATGQTSTSSSNSSGGSSFSYLLLQIADLIGSIWFIFPMIAGKLMTNDLLYGKVFHMDDMLWHIWNFSRTLANYAIGFIFIYSIFKYLLYINDKNASLIKSTLPKIVIASILVNASWFLMAVLIDISTILIAAFGSIPSQMGIATVPDLAFPKKIEIAVEKCDPKHNTACIRGSQKFNIVEQQSLPLKNIQQYETMVSGPLYYLGASILEIQNMKMTTLNKAYDFKAKKFKHNGEAIKAIVKIIIFFLFLIPMIILIVINVVRVFWVWMYISFSPLLFLDWVFGKNVLSSKQKAFAFKNVVGLIFQPALVVLAFGLSVIFIISVADALNTSEGKDIYKENVKKTFLLDGSDNGILVTDFGRAEATQEMSKYIGGFFGYIIVSLLAIIAVWSLIKMSFKATDVTSGISEKMFNFSEDLFKTIPMPTPMGKLSVGAFQYLGRNIASIPDTMIGNQSEKLMRHFKQEPDISENVYRDLHNKLTNQNATRAEKQQALDKLFEELTRFKDRPEQLKPHTKKLIDELVKGIKQKGTMSSLNLDNARTYEEKLRILLRNEETIKEKFIL